QIEVAVEEDGLLGQRRVQTFLGQAGPEMAAEEFEVAALVAGQNVGRPLARVPGDLGVRVLQVGIDATGGEQVDETVQVLLVVLALGIGHEVIAKQKGAVAVEQDTMTWESLLHSRRFSTEERPPSCGKQQAGN